LFCSEAPLVAIGFVELLRKAVPNLLEIAERWIFVHVSGRIVSYQTVTDGSSPFGGPIVTTF